MSPADREAVYLFARWAALNPEKVGDPELCEKVFLVYRSTGRKWARREAAKRRDLDGVSPDEWVRQMAGTE